VLDPAYHFTKKPIQRLTVDGKQHKQVYAKRDQFAAEIVYFSQCILEGKEPEPSGLEGLADVRIIEALLRSVRENRPIKLEPLVKEQRPSRAQEIHRPPVSEPDLVHAQSPES
jgi:predicted dehydrogenase